MAWQQSVSQQQQYQGQSVQPRQMGASATSESGTEGQSPVLLEESVGFASNSSEIGSFEMEAVIRSLAESNSKSDNSKSDESGSASISMK